MAGQIEDATLVAAPRQRDADDAKVRIKAGEKAQDIRPDEREGPLEGHRRPLDGGVP